MLTTSSLNSLVVFFCCGIYAGISLCSLQATFDCLMKTYGFLTPDLWTETRFTKSPYQEYTDLLFAKPTAKVTLIEEASERVDV